MKIFVPSVSPLADKSSGPRAKTHRAHTPGAGDDDLSLGMARLNSGRERQDKFRIDDRFIVIGNSRQTFSCNARCLLRGGKTA
jgi:hypothetical protein